MIAVLKHELRSYFHSLTAYVFGAFLLLFIGLGSMLYNIQAAVSNFEFGRIVKSSATICERKLPEETSSSGIYADGG